VQTEKETNLFVQTLNSYIYITYHLSILSITYTTWNKTIFSLLRRKS